MSPTDSTLATVYLVHRRQVARWRNRGIDVLDPAAVAAAIAAQNRPGKTLDRLLVPGALADTAAAIRRISTTV